MTVSTQPATGLNGEIRVAPDKSISHRSIMFSALATGESRVCNLLLGEDVLSTLAIFNQLGVKTSHTAAELKAGDELIIHGVGLRGLKASTAVLNCGNSGTTMRLLLGLLSGQHFESRLTGDRYLNKRPMERVTKPLTEMGARFQTVMQGEERVLSVLPVDQLKGIVYRSPVASAQVKSALILAGLYAQGTTTVTEPSLSRDHTERMLRAQGVAVDCREHSVTVHPPKILEPLHLTVPGDISSAAFFIVGALITPKSNLLIRDVCLNPTRTGIVDVLRAMGGDIMLENPRQSGGEEVGDLRVRSSKLKNISVGSEMIPRLIDEIPILALAAAVAQGEMILSDAQELRVKETDRIKAVCTELGKLGVPITEMPDGFVLQGGEKLHVPAQGFNSFGDHRMAMTEMIAGLILNTATTVDETDCIKTSFPDFFAVLNQARR